MNRKSCHEEKFRKISTVSLFCLDPEVVLHTNDVTLNSSIDYSTVAATCENGIDRATVETFLNTFNKSLSLHSQDGAGNCKMVYYKNFP
jgi:hypothetical protein